MEDVLDVYQRPYDPLNPVVCIDETNKQLIKETRIPCAPGQPEKVDSEYERNGVANVFMIFEPLAGKRETIVTQSRTTIDFANSLKSTSDIMYPYVEKIVLVTDNLNTHSPASLYKAFSPEEAHPNCESVRVALHAKTRELVRYGGNRNWYYVPSSSCKAASRYGGFQKANQMLDSTAQQRML